MSELIQRGKGLESEGKYNAALICFDQAINQGHSDHLFEAVTAKLNLLEQLNRYEDMLSTCDQVLKKRSNYDYYFLIKKGGILKTHFYHLNKHVECFNRALEVTNKTISKDPTKPWNYQEKAKALFLLDKFTECFETLEIALEFSVEAEEKGNIFYDQARYYEEWYEQTKNLDFLHNALKSYKKASSHGEDVDIYIESVRSTIEDYKKLETLNRKLEGTSKNAKNYIEKIELTDDMNDIFEIFDQAVLNVSDAKGLGELYASRAFYEFYQNTQNPFRYEKAMECLEKAIEYLNQARRKANGWREEDEINQKIINAYDSMGNHIESKAKERDDNELYELAIDLYIFANDIKAADYDRLNKISDLESRLGYGAIFNRRPQKSKEALIERMKAWRQYL
ncbi:hypothetical protein GXP70_09810 [Paenibacillus lycopersici]|uniref:Tetratricopeptide repeat protein n=1 Tax=Paenibacillus lycopersici TaxID=2704462 RepID=A0A6C0FTM2_9BACL|nr:hypothetical protein [Paenibacillus lycopersici]QHT60207.1 hypothetical protein GXP70_09810 [Paenibacillus lycopersici]